MIIRLDRRDALAPNTSGVANRTKEFRSNETISLTLTVIPAHRIHLYIGDPNGEHPLGKVSN